MRTCSAAAASKQVHVPAGKRLERQLIILWKVLTRSRRKQRASFMPTDFVSVTSRRRSAMRPLSCVRV
ncbi:hypothetical protein FA13DRAFT_269067 [Coprinellus micaceus]|uniref:Uncharacterized protein n=1 Tax=Coprinellus micaceus TaxID=71717 RepID=A0A4Y7SF92_COPMI|nr:hypothetical protein FA13DRAFT_269067 [Coprinellus micaceus]